METDGWAIIEETEEGYESAGYSSPSTQEIGMGPLLLQDTVQFLQTLAHETGHAYNNLPEDPSTRDLYVASQLKDEGGATYNNIKVQREILAAGGIDIGIAGAGAEEYNATYDRLVEGRDPSEIVLDDVFVALGANFGTAEESSVPIDRGQGNEYVNYQTYYEHQYSQI